MFLLRTKSFRWLKRQTTLTRIAANVFAEIEQMGMKKEMFQHSKIIAGATIALCSGKTDLYQLMAQFAEFSDSLYAHAVAVSTVSVMIGLGLNWKSLTMEKLGLGGLLHDIGKRELSPALLKKTRALMTPKEVLDYESHCFRGMQILRSIPEVPDDVVSCAYEHHENSLGQGFPRKIKLMYINPLARIVGLSDEFCNLTMKMPKGSFPSHPPRPSNISKRSWASPFGPTLSNS